MQAQIVERWETQNEAGRRFFGRGDFARAEQAFAAAIREAEQLGAADLRWVEFRLADTSWRAHAGTQSSDQTPVEQAKKKLEDLIRVIEKETDRDLVWAEAHESLGDLFWTRRQHINWKKKSETERTIVFMRQPPLNRATM